MTDEKFAFIEDLRDKKKTATGAHHRRTHCGKGGAVRLPSDFKTAKELRAMNGEVKSYKLNDPMSWAEFKAMPDDIKVAYITALRKKYNVSDTKIAEMMGTDPVNLSKEARRLGIKSTRKSREKWDADGWYAWVNGVKLEAGGEPAEAPDWLHADPDSGKCVLDDAIKPEAEKCDCAAAHLVPRSGLMELEGHIDLCANTLTTLLSDKIVKLTVSWELT